MQAHCRGGDHRVSTVGRRLIARKRKQGGKASGIANAEISPLIFRIRRSVQTDGKAGVQVEVQARLTNDEVQDRETVSYAYL